MNNLLNIKTPAEGVAGALQCTYGLDNHGLVGLRKVYWNLPAEALYEESIFRGEAQIVNSGALRVVSGKKTARAAQDKFIVRDADTEGHIWWGEYNRPMAADKFEE
ncbi:MAG: hypothetical protein Fur0018_20600 [Anaerolineales bacterium]